MKRASTIFWRIHQSYEKTMQRSLFELAANKLGLIAHHKTSSKLTTKQCQEALLKIFQISGYFQAETLWQSILALKLKDPELVFKQMYTTIRLSNAEQENPLKFNVRFLRKNLGKNTDLDEQDMMDFILVTAQTAFGRKLGQEREEITSLVWTHQRLQNYLDAARALGLIDLKNPQNIDYDAVWIAGALRTDILCRLIDLYQNLSKFNLKIHGEIAILTGNRELWAEVEGIAPSVKQKIIECYQTGKKVGDLKISVESHRDETVNEGMEYIQYLAQKNNIKLNPTKPFIQYTKEDCPRDRFPLRTYPNYEENETQTLTETLMIEDLISTYFQNKMTIIDTKAQENSARPTTASTAKAAAERLARQITNGDFKGKKNLLILFQTNNPHIERQTIITQREVDTALHKHGLSEKGYKVKVEGVGFSCKQDMKTVHSEFAALMAEKWMVAEKFTKKRPIEDLLYQTREHRVSSVPMPDVSDIRLTRTSCFKMFVCN